MVYSANYLRFFERARSSYFRLIGFENAKLRDGDDLLVTAVSEAASITPEGRPKRAPKLMVEKLKRYLES